jgi:hypothetical protein
MTCFYVKGGEGRGRKEVEGSLPKQFITVESLLSIHLCGGFFERYSSNVHRAHAVPKKQTVGP